MFQKSLSQNIACAAPLPQTFQKLLRASGLRPNRALRPLASLSSHPAHLLAALPCAHLLCSCLQVCWPRALLSAWRLLLVSWVSASMPPPRGDVPSHPGLPGHNLSTFPYWPTPGPTEPLLVCLVVRLSSVPPVLGVELCRSPNPHPCGVTLFGPARLFPK